MLGLGATLPVGAVAVPDPLSGGWPSGNEQRLGRTQHKALWDGSTGCFLKVPGSAQTGSVIPSLIETAKENGLALYRYLCWVLRNDPALYRVDAAWTEQLMPADG